VKTPELKKEIQSRGVDAVNSDEEGNPYLDEAQQEMFVTQMTSLVEEYIARWRSMFAWVAILALYIHGGCLIGLCPWTREFALYMSSIESVIMRFFFAPFSLGSGLYQLSGWAPVLIGTTSIVCDITIFRICMTTSLESNRDSFLRKFRAIYTVLSALVFGGWMVVAMAARLQPLWGKHTVLMVITPLLGFAGDTFVSSKILAIAGLEKLNQFKYSYKKI